MVTEQRDSPIVVDVEQVPTAVIRHEGITMADIGSAFDGGFPAVAAAVAGAGLVPAGPAFARYDGDPSRAFTLELGFPLSAPLPAERIIGERTVRPSSLPAGRAVVFSHIGGYDGIGGAWGRLMTWIADNDLTPVGAFWEVYVTEPSPEMDPATLRTDLVRPVA